MGLLALLERELGGHVFLQQRNLVDRSNNLAIEILIGFLLLCLLLLEEVVVNFCRHFNTRDVDLRLGSNHVRLWDATKGDTIDGIWATDEQQTTVELLQEHDTLSLEATSQEDQHSPLGDASTELGLLAVVVIIAQLLLGVLRGVVPAGLLAYGGSDCRLSLPWLAHSFTLISRGDLHLYTDVPPC